MASGYYLTLMVGPVVPVPAPKAAMDALTGVQVTTAAGQRSGFQLTFTLAIGSSLHLLFLPPLMRVIIVVTINGVPQVIMDGVVTHIQSAPSNTPGQSVLTVTGQDLTALMDLTDFGGLPFPAMPAEGRVALILAKYFVFGLVPMVIPSIQIDVPLPTERIPVQHGTDLAYINELAEKVGYVFYLDPGPAPRMNLAYWGPEIKVGVPQPALNVNMDASTNVESLSFSYDALSKTLPIVYIQQAESQVPILIPIPDVSPLNPPLGLVSPPPLRTQQVADTAKMTPIQAVLIGLAKAAKSAESVTGSGTLDVVRYGRPLKARQLVGVRGAGPAFDGLYYVRSVTHSIKQGEYKQNFTLSRNGVVSTVPKVPA